MFDIKTNLQLRFPIKKGYDVDEEVNNLTCVDTYRLVAIFNYSTPLDKQILEHKTIEQKKNCFSLKFIR